jgi:hypothetical protein
MIIVLSFTMNKTVMILITVTRQNVNNRKRYLVLSKHEYLNYYSNNSLFITDIKETLLL